jgi:hypothetical protein
MGQWFKFQGPDGNCIWVLAKTIAEGLAKLVKFFGGDWKIISNGDDYA